MNDWEYDMWWDAVNGMEEDYDDMDDWQYARKGVQIFSPKLKGKQKLRNFFVRLAYEKQVVFFREFGII